ncbi:hypothetical protein NEF87_000208 [Candidatus Lokiarchaeum ossiferum]|uniref:Transposase IS4-like domain-containing protein n=1 Tax=Candidatus Lokiarchaeum ossiferum TaxID=2951803 RepID=A0ABY6HKU0_9ARCH|nr:hypothetical protein NEF87_000208 [Candidatus Lokiarchaeum sp. B-35]
MKIIEECKVLDNYPRDNQIKVLNRGYGNKTDMNQWFKKDEDVEMKLIYSCQTTSYDKTYSKWEKETNYFKQNLNSFIEDINLNNKFVVIYKQKIIDQGKNEYQLYSRYKAKIPNDVFIIMKVEKPHLYTIEK